MVRQADTEKTIIKEEGFYIYRSLKTGDIACHARPCGKVKGKNGATSSDRKKMENKVSKEVAAHGATEGMKAKAPAPPEGGTSKMAPVPLTRKAEAPKDPENMAFPPRPHHPMWPIRRQQLRVRGRWRKTEILLFCSPKNHHSIISL